MTGIFHRMRRASAGDTIVEVMISMAVLGGTLGISYAIANNSLQQSQDAQERTQVVKILQSQLELLRASAGLPNTKIYDATIGNFCFYTDSAGQIQLASSQSGVPTSPSVDGHGPCTQGFYNYYITRGPNDTFTATCGWVNAMGTSRGDTATLVYRLHPAS